MKSIRKILLVDDDKDDQELFCEAVKIVDSTVVCDIAHNSIDALNQLSSSTTLPDFIFLDINMPLMDGKSCLRKIKNDQRLKQIPVIVYSTTRDQEEINLVRYLGADFMMKPTQFDVLINALKNYLAPVGSA